MVRRILSLMLCLSMIITMGLWIPERVYADETEYEYIVVVDSDSGYEDLIENYEDEIIETSENTSILNDQNTIVLSVTDSEAAELQQEADVTIEPNYVLQASVAGETEDEDAELEVLPEDSLWHLDMMNVQSYGNGSGSTGVKVALLDTGVAPGSALNLSESINLIPRRRGSRAFI